jgi:predicted transcriptional regulator
MVRTVENQPDHPGEGLRRVRDIMIPLEDYPWIRLQDTILDAIRVMEDAHLQVGRRPSLPRVLLVFDHHNELVGVVRRRDIMRGLEPDFLVRQPLEDRVTFFSVGPDPLLTDLAGGVSLDTLLKGLREQSGRPVSDIVKPISTTLKPSDRLMKAVYEMVSMNESLIAVVEGDEVVGVVRSVDVLAALAQFL